MIDVKLLRAKNGSETLKVSHDNQSLYLHSPYNPENEASELTKDLDIQKNTIVFCFGLGLGYYIYKILEKCGPDNIVAVVEPSADIYSKTSKCKNIIELNDINIVKNIVSSDETQIFNFINKHIYYENITDIKIFIMPTYKLLFNDECKIFLNCIKNGLIASKVWFNTYLMFNEIWQDCIFKNINYIADSYNIDIFKNAFEQKPLIIVAGGPSLDKNVDYLKNIKGKLPILCMYTAYAVLKQHDIEPDFIVAIDSQQLKYESEDDSKQKITLPLFYLSSVDTQLLKKHTGAKILTPDSLNTFIFKVLQDFGVNIELLPIGGSVACTCLSLAKYFGVSEILLIGQDLSFTEQKSHASGSYYDGNDSHLIKSIRNSKLLTEGNNGDQVYTIPSFLSYKLWIESFIHDNKDIKVINATEGGALIKGAEIMTLENAYHSVMNKNFDVDRVISDRLSLGKMLTPSQKDAFIERMRQGCETLEDLRPEMDRGISLCEKLEKIFSENSTELNFEEINLYKSELDEIDEKIVARKNDLDIISLMTDKIVLEMSDEKNDKQQDNRDIRAIKQNIILYKGIKRSIDLMLEYAKTLTCNASNEAAF